MDHSTPQRNKYKNDKNIRLPPIIIASTSPPSENKCSVYEIEFQSCEDTVQEKNFKPKNLAVTQINPQEFKKFCKPERKIDGLRETTNPFIESYYPVLKLTLSEEVASTEGVPIFTVPKVVESPTHDTKFDVNTNGLIVQENHDKLFSNLLQEKNATTQNEKEKKSSPVPSTLVNKRSFKQHIKQKLSPDKEKENILLNLLQNDPDKEQLELHFHEHNHYHFHGENPDNFFPSSSNKDCSQNFLFPFTKKPTKKEKTQNDENKTEKLKESFSSEILVISENEVQTSKNHTNLGSLSTKTLILDSESDTEKNNLQKESLPLSFFGLNNAQNEQDRVENEKKENNLLFITELPRSSTNSKDDKNLDVLDQKFFDIANTKTTDEQGLTLMGKNQHKIFMNFKTPSDSGNSLKIFCSKPPDTSCFLAENLDMNSKFEKSQETKFGKEMRSFCHPLSCLIESSSSDLVPENTSNNTENIFNVWETMNTKNNENKEIVNENKKLKTFSFDNTKLGQNNLGGRENVFQEPIPSLSFSKNKPTTSQNVSFKNSFNIEDNNTYGWDFTTNKNYKIPKPLVPETPKETDKICHDFPEFLNKSLRNEKDLEMANVTAITFKKEEKPSNSIDFPPPPQKLNFKTQISEPEDQQTSENFQFYKNDENNKFDTKLPKPYMNFKSPLVEFPDEKILNGNKMVCSIIDENAEKEFLDNSSEERIDVKITRKRDTQFPLDLPQHTAADIDPQTYVIVNGERRLEGSSPIEREKSQPCCYTVLKTKKALNYAVAQDSKASYSELIESYRKTDSFVTKTDGSKFSYVKSEAESNDNTNPALKSGTSQEEKSSTVTEERLHSNSSTTTVSTPLPNKDTSQYTYGRNLNSSAESDTSFSDITAKLRRELMKIKQDLHKLEKKHECSNRVYKHSPSRAPQKKKGGPKKPNISVYTNKAYILRGNKFSTTKDIETSKTSSPSKKMENFHRDDRFLEGEKGFMCYHNTYLHSVRQKSDKIKNEKEIAGDKRRMLTTSMDKQRHGHCFKQNQ